MESSTSTESELTPDSFDHEGTDLTPPADRPLGVEDPGVTLDHQRRGDTLEERIAREVPEDDPGESARDSAAIPAEEAALHVTKEL